MALEIPHFLEVLFDGVGGAALIALVTAWNEHRREVARQGTTKSVRRPVWVYGALGAFAVFVLGGVAMHFYNGTTKTANPAAAHPVILPPVVAQLPPAAERPEPAKQRRVATTADEVTALISEHLQVSRADVKPEDDLVLDLGATPMDVAEIVMALETSYDIQIPRNDQRKLKSVGDMIDYVERREHTGKAKTSP
jgi:acyl carrier protein